MKMLDYVNEIKRHLTDVTSQTTSAIEMAINNAYFQIWNKANWWFARREYYFDTIAAYTTGTLTATKNSATITGAGTAFTSAMIGRKLIVGGDDVAYIVKSVASGTSLTLETIYLGTTVSGSTYGIYKHLYRLNDRAMKILWAVTSKDKVKLQESNERRYIHWNAYSTSKGNPTHYIPRGQTTAVYYNTGTVAVTNSSATVTSTYTTFTSDMTDMVFKVVGDDVEYSILSVDSASQITLNKAFDGTTNLTASYEIGPAGTEQIELWPAPDIAMQVKYKAHLRPLKLVADNDVPELPQQWHEGILLGALAKVLPGRAINESEIMTYRQEYASFLQDIMNYHDVNEDENPYFEENYAPPLEDDNWWVLKS